MVCKKYKVVYRIWFYSCIPIILIVGMSILFIKKIHMLVVVVEILITV